MQPLPRRLVSFGSLAGGLLLALVLATAAEAATKVPPGNRSATQPPISHSSIARTAETKGDFETKFRAIMDQLASEPELIGKIEAAAATYGIDPIHIVGALVGEHTYNVDVFDSMQGYYVKALSYLNTAGLRFAYQGEAIETFVARPEFAECAEGDDDYAVWSCRERVWRTTFQGKTVDGTTFADERFERAFFQPFFAGQTFGLGQLNPLAALMVSDMVHDKSGLPELDMRRAPEVYRAVMDPDMTLAYMAATIRNDIDIYRKVAGFDISGNPGVTATLYNVGQAGERAEALAAENRKRRAAGQAPLYPQENYYGWLINDRLKELQALLDPEVATATVPDDEDKPAMDKGAEAEPPTPKPEKPAAAAPDAGKPAAKPDAAPSPPKPDADADDDAADGMGIIP